MQFESPGAAGPPVVGRQSYRFFATVCCCCESRIIAVALNCGKSVLTSDWQTGVCRVPAVQRCSVAKLFVACLPNRERTSAESSRESSPIADHVDVEFQIAAYRKGDDRQGLIASIRAEWSKVSGQLQDPWGADLHELNKHSKALAAMRRQLAKFGDDATARALSEAIARSARTWAAVKGVRASLASFRSKRFDQVAAMEYHLQFMGLAVVNTGDITNMFVEADLDARMVPSAPQRLACSFAAQRRFVSLFCVERSPSLTFVGSSSLHTN